MTAAPVLAASPARSDPLSGLQHHPHPAIRKMALNADYSHFALGGGLMLGTQWLPFFGSNRIDPREAGAYEL
jgi:hypothetical protein